MIRDDHYSIFHFILKNIYYMLEQTLEKLWKFEKLDNNWPFMG